MPLRRILLLVFGSGLTLVAGASPAAADPAKPGDYSSEVTAIEPAADGVHVEVAGGDGFLDVRVDPGHEVFVLGYDPDGDSSNGNGAAPYLWIQADGTVSENLRSPATYINVDRYAAATAPTDLSPDDEPEWRRIATGGRYAWHDHRIHWMSPTPPPNASAGDVIYDDWQVELIVDGTDVVVHGELTWERGTPAILWFGLAAAVAAALAFAAGFRTVRVAGAALLAASIGSVVVGVAEYVSIPPGAGASILTVIVPAVGALAALVALLRSRSPAGAIGGLASVAALAGWALLRVSVLLEPVLPTHLPFVLDRLGTVLAIGAAVAGAVVVVNSGVLRLPELSDDE